jgi:hypothetical protein
VLGVVGQDEAPFSQGALPAFRQRLIAKDMDRRLSSIGGSLQVMA